MVTIETTDGRRLVYDDDERVYQLGYWSDTRPHERLTSVRDIRPGTWIRLHGAERLRDRDFDLALVREVSGGNPTWPIPPHPRPPRPE